LLRIGICGILGPVVVKKCRFCDCGDAVAQCGWPTTQRSEVLVEDLKVGDIWITGRNRGTIVEIEDFDLTRRFWVSRPGHDDPDPHNRFRGGLERIERLEMCDNACCFRHRRRIGPDRYYCVDHWGAWETIS
jgi:hypothetical protein